MKLHGQARGISVLRSGPMACPWSGIPLQKTHSPTGKPVVFWGVDRFPTGAPLSPPVGKRVRTPTTRHTGIGILLQQLFLL